MGLIKPLGLIDGKKSEISIYDILDNTGPRYQSITYSGGLPSVVEYFNSATFIPANRAARHELTFTSLLLTSEVLKVYDSDGVTIIKTYTWTHVYSGSDLQSSGLVVT